MERRSIRQRGVVAVVKDEDRLLLIRRSQHVVAPGMYCFPGGGIEKEEPETTALQRELLEELAAHGEPIRRLWTSTTPWGVHLAWWHVHLPNPDDIVPNQQEVESVCWCTAEQMHALKHLLESNLHFLHAWQQGEFDL